MALARVYAQCRKPVADHRPAQFSAPRQIPLYAVLDNIFELELPHDALEHGTYVELRLIPSQNAAKPNGKALKRVPAFAAWVEQNAAVPEQWCARLWLPQAPYRFKHPRPARAPFPRIYEAHVGMAQPAQQHHGDSMGSYEAFSRDILPRIKASGYTAVQLMGILEHPLYRSFGYQVSSYFAPSSRYGTPDGFRALVDAAHALGLAVLLDVPHGHASAIRSRVWHSTTAAGTFLPGSITSGVRPPLISVRR